MLRESDEVQSNHFVCCGRPMSLVEGFNCEDITNLCLEYNLESMVYYGVGDVCKAKLCMGMNMYIVEMSIETEVEGEENEGEEEEGADE